MPPGSVTELLLYMRKAVKKLKENDLLMSVVITSGRGGSDTLF